MVAKITVSAPAKLNLFLDVKGRRDDGYHEIQTVMQTIDFCDRLHFDSASAPGINLTCRNCNSYALPPEKQNLVFKAAFLLRQRYKVESNADIELEKLIPPGAGLGGGSSDAASALKALSKLWKLGLDWGQLEHLASSLGSDVPFFIRGGTGLCTGRGEIVGPLQNRRKFDFVVVLPPLSVSTSEVYSACDSLTKKPTMVNIENLKVSLHQGDPDMLGANLFNALKGPALKVCASLSEVEKQLQRIFSQTGCCGYSLSGSGSAWFGVYSDPKQAEEAGHFISEKTEMAAFAVQSASSNQSAFMSGFR